MNPLPDSRYSRQAWHVNLWKSPPTVARSLHLPTVPALLVYLRPQSHPQFPGAMPEALRQTAHRPIHRGVPCSLCLGGRGFQDFGDQIRVPLASDSPQVCGHRGLGLPCPSDRLRWPCVCALLLRPVAALILAAVGVAAAGFPAVVGRVLKRYCRRAGSTEEHSWHYSYTSRSWSRQGNEQSKYPGRPPVLRTRIVLEKEQPAATSRGATIVSYRQRISAFDVESQCSWVLLETRCELTERFEFVVHETNQVAVHGVGLGELRILTLTVLDFTLARKVILL